MKISWRRGAQDVWTHANSPRTRSRSGCNVPFLARQLPPPAKRNFPAAHEYGTALWRAGGGSFGGEANIPTGTADYPFTLTYDPNGADGRGTVNATLATYTAVMTLDDGHKADGALFNRFGIQCHEER